MNTPLPLELADVQVNCGGMYPVLSWKSLKEVNTRRFVIEASADGRNWSVAGVVAAAGNSSAVIAYRMELKGNLNGMQLVRLRVEDLDGTQRTYQAVAVPCAKEVAQRNIRIAPNPNDGAFAIQFEGVASDEPAEIRVINALGVEVAQKLQDITDGSQLKMDLRGFAAGIYQVQVRFDGQSSVKTFKVIIR